jgi:prophage DNA circulation protein
MTEENNSWDVTVQDIEKIVAEEGDVLLVTLPEQSANLPNSQMQRLALDTAKAFETVLVEKRIKTIVIPNGMRVEVLKSSLLNNEND